jgi:hypothetical protein
MDAIRFDALTRACIAELSRRGTLAGVLAGTLAVLGLTDAQDADAAKSGKCKQKCGQCEFCKKGKCYNKDGKKRCKKGKCKPVEGGTPCTGGNGGCTCNRSLEGDGFCAANVIVKCFQGNCANSGECGAGSHCVRCSGSGATTCVPECGTV